MCKNWFLKKIFIQFLDFLIMQFWSEKTTSMYIIKLKKNFNMGNSKKDLGIYICEVTRKR